MSLNAIHENKNSRQKCRLFSTQEEHNQSKRWCQYA